MCCSVVRSAEWVTHLMRKLMFEQVNPFAKDFVTNRSESCTESVTASFLFLYA
jgi:hypothetical protein